MTGKTREALSCLRNHSLVRAKHLVKEGWEVIKMDDNSMTWQRGNQRFIDIFCL